MKEFQELTVSEAYALVKKANPEFARYVNIDCPWDEEEDPEWKVQFYEGDLVVDEDFTVGEDPVLIAGDLKINGLLDDVGEAENTALVVLGNLHARDILSTSSMFIGGKVKVEQLVFLNSLNDYAFVVGGDLRAGGLYGGGTATDVLGAFEVPKFHWCGNRLVIGSGADKKEIWDSPPADKCLLAKFVQDDGRVDEEMLQDALLNGEEVLAQ